MKLFFVTLLLGINSTWAYEYPDAIRDRPRVEQALRSQGINYSDLQFPLHKQVFNATLTAIAKLPEIVSAMTGVGDQFFVTLHTIQFKDNGELKTCGVYVRDYFSGGYGVEIAGCGKNHANILNSERVVLYHDLSVNDSDRGNESKSDLPSKKELEPGSSSSPQ